jgi:protein-disulfide isomerase
MTVQRSAPEGAVGKQKIGRWSLAAGVAGLVFGAGAMMLAGGGSVAVSDKAAIEQVVREYILSHPEIIRDAARLLQEREVAEVVEMNRAALEKPYAGAWAGAENGDVVLVEFFDYACGYCRKSNADVERLLREDKKLKVVWREWPVLGEPSVAAAEASLAAARQGKFKPFHDKLFELGRPTEAAVAAAKSAAGVGAESPRQSGRSEIEGNYQLAQAIGATGTPVFVVGDQVLQGAVGYDALKKAIATARAK